jgi:hypothetical protein
MAPALSPIGREVSEIAPRLAPIGRNGTPSHLAAGWDWPAGCEISHSIFGVAHWLPID